MLRTSGFSLFLSLVLLGCAPGGNHLINVDPGDDAEADKLLVVDCLLPGQIKKLGAGATYVTPRRPDKLTALECQNRGGEYVAYEQANAGSALKVWMLAAQEGDPVAQTYVGEIYEKGMGLEPNYVLAMQWYTKASSQGYSRAKLNLGYLYERGLGVKQNFITALNYYRDASGLTDTPMEFVASFDADAPGGGGTEQLRALKGELEEEKQKIQALRGQMELAESQVEEKRRDLESKSKKLDQERQELAKNSDPEKLKQAEQQLDKRRKEMARLSTDIDDYKSELTRLQAAPPKIALAGPSIQLINPSLINLRGASAAIAVPPNSKTREVIGRVQAPAGVKTFTVNKNAEQLNEQGVFRVLLALSEERTPVRLVAVDNQGKRSELEFALVWAKGPLPEAVVASSVGDDESHNYALVIGNNDYTRFPKLSTPMNDAKTVAEVLSQRYGYKTTTVMNANRYALLAALNRLSQKLTNKDNLLIYYAGHGEIDKEKLLGYWLPVDADLKDKRKWIPNNAITDIINALPAKRVLVIADSCYSGALTRSAVPQLDANLSEADRLSWLRAVSKSRARVALTSGGLQPVADSGGGTHSLFATVFLQVLQDNKSVLEGQRLYSEVAARLATHPVAMQIGQVPQYAPIRHAGHESGEFFFLPRRAI